MTLDDMKREAEGGRVAVVHSTTGKSISFSWTGGLCAFTTCLGVALMRGDTAFRVPSTRFPAPPPSPPSRHPRAYSPSLRSRR